MLLLSLHFPSEPQGSVHAATQSHKHISHTNHDSIYTSPCTLDFLLELTYYTHHRPAAVSKFCTARLASSPVTATLFVSYDSWRKSPVSSPTGTLFRSFRTISQASLTSPEYPRQSNWWLLSGYREEANSSHLHSCIRRGMFLSSARSRSHGTLRCCGLLF